MNGISILDALILGIVEGLTEFLPISSTGHLILASSLLGANDQKGKVFELVIQSGAMLAIVWEYRRRFADVLLHATGDEKARRFLTNLFIAFLPLATLGLLIGSDIKYWLFHPVPVAVAFIVGGFIILWVENRHRPVRVEDVDGMTWKDALLVGLAQAVALIPGMSRSGSTIIGGMLFGLSRRAATEFSFFLAVPTLMVAGAYDFYRHRDLMSASDTLPFAVGLLTAFASAFVCVRWLIRFIATHDFKVFAWYRIAFGIVVLLTSYFGWVDWNAA